jgi:hypothetical protein
MSTGEWLKRKRKRMPEIWKDSNIYGTFAGKGASEQPGRG